MTITYRISSAATIFGLVDWFRAGTQPDVANFEFWKLRPGKKKLGNFSHELLLQSRVQQGSFCSSVRFFEGNCLEQWIKITNVFLITQLWEYKYRIESKKKMKKPQHLQQ